MADEIKDENTEESEELESQEPQSEGADEENLADAGEVVAGEEEAGEEGEGEGEGEEAASEFEKSAAEILAEQVMLAELEASAQEEEQEVVLPPEQDDNALSGGPKNLELLLDVSLNITVELGRKEMRFGEVLNLGKGSLVELNKIADEPVDIYVNQSKIAEGEVVVVDDHFGVRITRLVSTEKSKSFS